MEEQLHVDLDASLAELRALQSREEALKARRVQLLVMFPALLQDEIDLQDELLLAWRKFLQGKVACLPTTSDSVRLPNYCVDVQAYNHADIHHIQVQFDLERRRSFLITRAHDVCQWCGKCKLVSREKMLCDTCLKRLSRNKCKCMCDCPSRKVLKFVLNGNVCERCEGNDGDCRQFLPFTL